MASRHLPLFLSNFSSRTIEPKFGTGRGKNFSLRYAQIKIKLQLLCLWKRRSPLVYQKLVPNSQIDWVRLKCWSSHQFISLFWMNARKKTFEIVPQLWKFSFLVAKSLKKQQLKTGSYLLECLILLLGGEAEVALLAGAELGRLLLELLLPLLHRPDLVATENLQRLNELLVCPFKLKKHKIG